VKQLDKGERPSVANGRKQVLELEEITRLITAAPARYQALVATVAYTGVRISEALGLVWDDVDFDAGVVHVRKQLGRDGQRVRPKTDEAVRDVMLLGALAGVLRAHKLASSHSGPDDFVFASEMGTPLQVRNVSRRGLDKAIEDAGLAGHRIGWHLLRHGFGSMLLAQGENVVFVSGQLGHADPKITLGIYAHEFNQEAQLEQARRRLDAEHGTALEHAIGDGRQPAANVEAENVLAMRL
jgi:integrase